MQDIQDVIASFTCYRRGTLTMSDWLRSLRGVDERAWYAADDPLPVLLMCLWMPVRAASRNLISNNHQGAEAPQPQLISR